MTDPTSRTTRIGAYILIISGRPALVNVIIARLRQCHERDEDVTFRGLEYLLTPDINATLIKEGA